MMEDWVKEELKSVDIGDKRLDKRLMMLVSAMARNSEASIPLACESHAATKAAYRFFDDAHVQAEDICSAHIQSTVERVKDLEGVLLVIQDTTDFNFTHHPSTEGLGHLNNTYLKGLKMHSGLAVNQGGVPQGLLHLLIWTRDKKKIGKSVSRRQKKTEEKESIRWLDAVKSIRDKIPDSVDVVHIADREAGIFDLFDCVYWNRRVDTLRRIYAERQQYVNLINNKKKHFDMKQMKGILAKIKDLEGRIDSLPTSKMVKKIVSKLLEENGISRNPLGEYESKIVNTKEEIIRLSNLGFDCQAIGNREWLMRKKALGQLPS